MEAPLIKFVKLSREEINLSHVIIQVNGMRQHRPAQAHKELETKIDFLKILAQNHRQRPYFVCAFDEAESRLMRDYNQNYCFILAGNLEFEESRSDGLPWEGALDTYQLATRIQMRFSTRHQ